MTTLASKICNVCDVDLPISNFYTHPSTRDGYAHKCKPCHGAQGRDNKYQRRYGISAQEVDRIIAAQENRCEICHCDMKNRAHVDHDHSTGGFRGIVCGPCNQAMGLLRDDPEIFRAAIAYLERSRS